MILLVKLNGDDLEKIRAIPNSFKAAAFVYSFFGIPFSFLIGFFGLLKKRIGYWPMTLAFLIFFILALLWTLIRDYVAYRRDLTNQIKLKGTITVTGKSTKKGDTIIFTDSQALKKVQVLKDVFDRINIGDKLVIEISKYSKCLLLLEKNGSSLMNVS